MENSLPEVARGFTVWIEPESLHYHTGIVQARALWGRMMQREGSADTRGWTCYALDPSGALLDADVAPGEGNFHKVAFFAQREGLYNLVVENHAGVYSMLPGGVWEKGPLYSHSGAPEAVRYLQRARISIPVGHHVHGPLSNLAAGGLDVFCDEFREYRLGDSIAVRVFYNGRPLPGAELKATYHLYAGSARPRQGNAGADGGITFTFPEKGHWMFTCSYTDNNQNEEGDYTKTVHTSTFVVAGVR